jgi:hypothetical protein
MQEANVGVRTMLCLRSVVNRKAQLWLSFDGEIFFFAGSGRMDWINCCKQMG